MMAFHTTCWAVIRSLVFPVDKRSPLIGVEGANHEDPPARKRHHDAQVSIHRI